MSSRWLKVATAETQPEKYRSSLNRNYDGDDDDDDDFDEDEEEEEEDYDNNIV